MSEENFSLIEEVTNDFCEAFQKEEDYDSCITTFVAEGLLPLGVNIHDERVKAIIKKCKEKVAEKK